MRDGDSNRNFFHNFASARKKKNTITHLVDDAGTKWEDPQGVSNLIMFYFEGLFTSEVQVPDANVINKVPANVTSEMNRSLLRPFSEEEVWKALFQTSKNRCGGTPR